MGRLSPLLLALALLLSVSSFNVSAEDGDSDGDGWTDYHEESCGTDPLNWQDVPLDTDSSGICDYLDADDDNDGWWDHICLLYTSPSPRDLSTSRMPSSA